MVWCRLVSLIRHFLCQIGHNNFASKTAFAVLLAIARQFWSVAVSWTHYFRDSFQHWEHWVRQACHHTVLNYSNNFPDLSALTMFVLPCRSAVCCLSKALYSGKKMPRDCTLLSDVWTINAVVSMPAECCMEHQQNLCQQFVQGRDSKHIYLKTEWC